MTSTSRAGYLATATLAFLLLLSVPALAAATVHTWTGGGGAGNQLWSSASNWDANGVPVDDPINGTVVQFGSSTTSTMDINGLIVDEVHFTGANNTINGTGGRVLSLRGTIAINNVLSDGAGNTFASTLPLALTGGLTIFVNSTSGQLTIAGPISGSAAGVRFLGSGATGTTLTGANTYTTNTTVASGTLHLNNGGVNTAIVGPLITVGVSNSTPATLTLDQSVEIADATNISLGSDGTFNTGIFSDAINGLKVLGGAVTVGGSGTVTVNGTLDMTGGTVSGTGTLAIKGDVAATSSATAAATVSSPVSIAGTRAFAIADGPQATDLNLSNVIANGASAGGLSKSGTGTLLLSTALANTYTGPTSVSDGVLLLNGNALAVIPAGGALTVGDGSGAPSSATVLLGQNSEIGDTASVSIAADGLLDLSSHSEQIAPLTVQDGAVAIGTGTLRTSGLLTMAGGSITGTGVGILTPSGDVQASSSAVGPATISAGVHLTADRTVTVTPGTAPELTISGVIDDGGGGFGIAKAGTGTLVTSGAETDTGLTTVAAGTLVANGSQPGPVSVATAGRLTGSGSVGATSVAGTLAPTAPALKTGALTFTAGGKLRVDVPSASVAPVAVTGAVSIDPTATLDLHAPAPLALAANTKLLLIDDDAADAISGRFANAPSSTVLAVSGLPPLTPSYSGGTGNDLVASVNNLAPVIGSAVSASPNPVVAGQPVALSVTATDANNDPLSVSWSFGDGSDGSGSATSHVYAAAGSYTASATVTDGIAQTTSSTVVTVTAAPGGQTPPPACQDGVAPVTAIGKLALTRRGLTVSGRSGDTRCGTAASPALVSVAIARKLGKRCQWLGTKGLASCARVPARALKPATGTASFSYKIRHRFAPGRYLVVALARDAAGNVEKVTAKRVVARRLR